MNIKSLLLGSAAALVAVSGARAADAIIVEPEPVEYVRVCDVYGAGFFYIPGTETCLQISGYVWYQIGFSSEEDHYLKNSRARLNVDARSDTEWGTLRSYIRFQGSATNMEPSSDFFSSADLVDEAVIGVDINGDGDTTDTLSISGLGGVGVDQAFIELGGLRMGYTESAWVTSQRVGVGQYGSHSWGGLSYGYQQRQLISYTFGGGNGFAATVSLESDDYHDDSDYMPDVVGVVSFNQGWGGVWAKVGFDEDATGAGDDSEWGAQAGVQFNMPNMPGSSLRLIGYYATDANIYAVGSEWSVLASYNHQFSATLGASVGFQYFSDTNYDAAGEPDAWQGELSVVWTPVTNFEVRGEVTYFDEDGDDDEVTTGFLRFTRYF